MLLKCCTQYVSKLRKFSSDHRTRKGQFATQCQGVLKLPYDCTQFICQQGYALNPSSQASAICEPRISRCISRAQKKQMNQRSNANICWIIEKAMEFQNSIYFCFIDYAKAFDCVDQNKLWKILKEMRIPDHLICLLGDLYVVQEATVRTGYGSTDQFKTRKGVHQVCIRSLCLFNFDAEYIIRNARLDESHVGIKTAGGNINNLRYTDDTTFMAESEEELKSPLMKMKEENE